MSDLVKVGASQQPEMPPDASRSESSTAQAEFLPISFFVFASGSSFKKSNKDGLLLNRIVVEERRVSRLSPLQH